MTTSTYAPDQLPLTAPTPVQAPERIPTLDVLRGVALLGILLMNIPLFALPDNISAPLHTLPSSDSLDYKVLHVVAVLFEGKMRALFSLLFGAGVVLFVTQKARTGRPVTGLYYRRMGWLIVLGLLHAHVLLWEGDILYMYGICGLVLFWFRKLKPAYLLVAALLCSGLNMAAFSLYYEHLRTQRLEYLAVVKAEQQHRPLTPAQHTARQAWLETESESAPGPQQTAAYVRTMRGSYWTVAAWLRPHMVQGQTQLVLVFIWDALSLMLLGMALLKWGFLTGEWSVRIYWGLLVVGYGLGLPAALYTWHHGFPFSVAYMEAHPVNVSLYSYPVQRLLLLLGHASGLILLVRSGVLVGVQRSLAAVGRLALTNYILQTVLCTLIFFGYGLGYFGRLAYHQLFYVVGAIWVVQLLGSSLWLRYYQIGPLEWVWRSLTYWQRQPLRRLENLSTTKGYTYLKP
ncbi:DUF418 domain-containing protein [Hymenobacter sp. GOD-10R]|uniref:DUF418 domain-containing protein n=1 Tax=Hymenobacter sp. GOD-10R TaxID=3093922 RepID=UPI002D79C3EE|nr:DUF418 domain-containing protein [Hymenobacter sp. GOD-10R]WRQ31114.1 DUF418 domain-containing protein [Hymenobacter sp. GOD-10R]